MSGNAGIINRFSRFDFEGIGHGYPPPTWYGCMPFWDN
jgi:hypothetical protein